MSALYLLHLSMLCSILVTVRNLPNEVDDATPQFDVLDLHEGFGERQAVGGGEKFGHVGDRRRHGFPLRQRRHTRPTLEEEGHWHLQDLRDLHKPARAHSIDALLVFLHLLKGQPNRIRKFRLAHSKHEPRHAHSAAHMLVGGVWQLLDHDRFHNEAILFCVRLFAARDASGHATAAPPRSEMNFRRLMSPPQGSRPRQIQLKRFHIASWWSAALERDQRARKAINYFARPMAITSLAAILMIVARIRFAS